MRQNPLLRVDPQGLQDLNLGQGFSGRVDTFNFGGQSSFEIHVFDKQGREVGVYGPDGWINKHGFSGRPDNLPTEVENRCRGIAVERLRAEGRLPEKGHANIKGDRLKKLLRGVPMIGPLLEATRSSVERVCEADSGHEACSGETR